MKRGIFPLVFHFRAVRGFSLESFFIFNFFFPFGRGSFVCLCGWRWGWCFVVLGLVSAVHFFLLLVRKTNKDRSCFKPKLNKNICDQKNKSLICIY